jgi:methyl-accepting chemotaxis protein
MTLEQIDRRSADYLEIVNGAVMRSQAFIEFDVNGTILNVNDVFLSAMGYQRQEVEGRHHRMFVDEGYAGSGEYREFWERLRAGEIFSGVFRRY